MLRCYTRDNLSFINVCCSERYVEIEMKNLNLQVTLLVQKGVGTRSHSKERCVASTSPHNTFKPENNTEKEIDDYYKTTDSWIMKVKAVIQTTHGGSRSNYELLCYKGMTYKH